MVRHWGFKSVCHTFFQKTLFAYLFVYCFFKFIECMQPKVMTLYKYIYKVVFIRFLYTNPCRNAKMKQCKQTHFSEFTLYNNLTVFD